MAVKEKKDGAESSDFDKAFDRISMGIDLRLQLHLRNWKKKYDY